VPTTSNQQEILLKVVTHLSTNEHLIDVAASTLESIGLIAEKAGTALTDARRNPASALGQINTFTDEKAIGAGAGISQNLVGGYERLVLEPALARVSVIDENGNDRT
tara:strand:+ start:600 stop:920 length:321 start_codon:yes stop_codon:yes gene_type:complete